MLSNDIFSSAINFNETNYRNFINKYAGNGGWYNNAIKQGANKEYADKVRAWINKAQNSTPSAPAQQPAVNTAPANTNTVANANAIANTSVVANTTIKSSMGMPAYVKDKLAQQPVYAYQGTTLKAVPGYSQDGDNAWRSQHDQAIIDAANRYNTKHKYAVGTPNYLDPNLIKAWAMVESGGSKKAFTNDPLQVNNYGDWDDSKAKLGLERGKVADINTNLDAALAFLKSKGTRYDSQGNGTFVGYDRAFRNYNGNTRNTQIYDPSRPHMQHRDYYVQQVNNLYNSMNAI